VCVCVCVCVCVRVCARARLASVWLGNGVITEDSPDHQGCVRIPHPVTFVCKNAIGIRITTRYCYVILTKVRPRPKMLVTHHNVIFHDIRFRHSRVTARRQTVIRDEANRPILAILIVIALKIHAFLLTNVSLKFTKHNLQDTSIAYQSFSDWTRFKIRSR
jgi:hypothetical protein